MMKSIGLGLAATLLFCGPVWGQASETEPATAPQKEDSPMQTLFGGSDVAHGGYGALHFGGTRANGESVGLAGGRGGWLINHTLLLGLAGHSTTTTFKGDPDAQGNREDLNFSYGGFLMEWIPGWERAWHSAFGLLLGEGSVSTYTPEHCMGNTCTYTLPETDQMGVVELSARLEANLFRYMRAGLGVGYHWVRGMDFPYLKSDSLTGGQMEIFLIFGKF